MEIYTVASDTVSGFSSIKKFIRDFHGVKQNEFIRYAYQFNGIKAIRHLFRVAASLDSMIIGEPQILGQVKQAYLKANEYGAAGKELSNIFTEAIKTGGIIRRRTQIGRGAVSISSVTVELIKNSLGSMQGKRVLIMGAGKIGELTARILYAQGIQSIAVTNRDFQKARELACLLKGKAVKFEDFLESVIDADIIISCLSLSGFILKKRQIKRIMDRKHGRPLCIIDLGVPRNVEPDTGKIKNVRLYNIDDLAKVRDEHMKKRLKETKKAEQMIDQYMQRVAAVSLKRR